MAAMHTKATHNFHSHVHGSKQTCSTIVLTVFQMWINGCHAYRRRIWMRTKYWVGLTEINLHVVLFNCLNHLKNCFLMKSRHLNFFESTIQANIRKEAKNIPFAAFQFWSDQGLKNSLIWKLKNSYTVSWVLKYQNIRLEWYSQLWTIVGCAYS